nr:HDOD domain-containing protein [Pseudomonas sp. RIT-PI-AD]
MQSWVDRFNQAELPALASVVQDLQQLATEQHVSVRQLAEVLLRDAALTSKVLRIANSVYYNPVREPIRTLSRAIVLMGFETVRLIGLSVSLIDGLLGRVPREQVQNLLARSFHGAVQARNIAGYMLARQQEEVFIGALLQDLGELAFWGCAGAQADELAEALAQPGADSASAVREVTGTSFRQLTLGLAKNWGLGETVGLSQLGGPAADVVNLGTRIAQAALDGWDTAEMRVLVERLARFIGVSPEDALRQVLASADEAVKVAATFGIGTLSRLIPTRDFPVGESPARPAIRPPDADPLLLARVLQALGATSASRAEAASLLDLLLDGLQRGVGLERVMIAVLADGQRRFRAKRATGEQAAAWLEGFDLPAQTLESPHLFDYVLRSREPLWMGIPATSNLNDLVTRPMRGWFGRGMFFIAPLMAGHKSVGVLYADCRPSGRVLRTEEFVAFQRLARAAGHGLDALSKR